MKRKVKGSVNRSKIITAVIAVFLLLVIAYFFLPGDAGTWIVNSYGRLSYPENRGKIDITLLKTESGSNYTLETISYPSRDYVVGGLIRIPVSEKKVPAVVILPGATVPKEGTQGLAQLLSDMGYASIGIDQRNRGGIDPDYDYGLFKKGLEPVEHKMVFDALRAVDVLKQDSRIDANRIAVIGESNGGRFAIIATAIDPDIKGVIGISTSGYDMEGQLAGVGDETTIRFYRSIDPDTYLSYIPPRKLVLMHSVNDSIIPLELAQKTFRKAREPKSFYKIDNGNHGFNEEMTVPIREELKSMFE